MNSAGNDIISLNHIDIARTKQARFYTKFLLPAEVNLYNDSHLSKLNFENFVWLLWSVKESVFKFCKRNSPQLIFAPGKIIVESIQPPLVNNRNSFVTEEITGTSSIKKECYQCVITVGSHVFYSRSKLYTEIIHTIVNNKDDFNDIYWGIRQIENAQPNSQSENVRHLILKTISNLYPDAEISIDKNNAGCPVVKMNENEMNIPVSFTHHGHFVAYSFSLLE